MNNRSLLLPVAFFTMIGLVGCQSTKNNQRLSVSDFTHQVKRAIWGKTGEVFQVPRDSALKPNQSRVVFFRDYDDNYESRSIKIGIGSENTFQTSLTNGHYSDKIVCSSTSIVNVAVLNEESGDVTSYSKSYQLIPQTTTYLQVSLSTTGRPIIRQVPADMALSLLYQSTHQTHQISRIPSDCTIAYRVLRQDSVVASVIKNKIEINPLSQFKVLFDSDSLDINSSNYAAIDTNNTEQGRQNNHRVVATVSQGDN